MDLIIISFAVFLLAFVTVNLMDYPGKLRQKAMKDSANRVGYKFYANALRNNFDVFTFDVLFLNDSGAIGAGKFEYLLSNGVNGVLENRLPRNGALDYRSNVYFSKITSPHKIFIGKRRVAYNWRFFDKKESRTSKRVGSFMVEENGGSVPDKSLRLILEVLRKYSRPYVLASNDCLLFYDEGKTIKPSDLESFISDGKRISRLIGGND